MSKQLSIWLKINIFSWRNFLIASSLTILLCLNEGACIWLFEFFIPIFPVSILQGIYNFFPSRMIFIEALMLLFSPVVYFSYLAVKKYVDLQIIKKREQDGLIAVLAEKMKNTVELVEEYRRDCVKLQTRVHNSELRMTQILEQLDAFKKQAYADILLGG